MIGIPNYPNPTILDANLYALSHTFNDADLQPTSNDQLRTLLAMDPSGKLDARPDATTFTTSQGLVYEFGHGRNRCVPDMCMLKTQDMMAHNCGYHRQFYRPYDFQICGSSCSGSLCNCLLYYWIIYNVLIILFNGGGFGEATQNIKPTNAVLNMYAAIVDIIFSN